MENIVDSDLENELKEVLKGSQPFIASFSGLGAFLHDVDELNTRTRVYSE